MVAPQRKFNFIQTAKQALVVNNLWRFLETALREELDCYPQTDEQGGIPDDFFTFHESDSRCADNVYKLSVIHRNNLDDKTLEVIERDTVYGNCPTCFKMMPVCFSCPNCFGERAKVLHCVEDSLEVIHQEKTNREGLQAINDYPSPMADPQILSETAKETPLCRSRR